MFLRLDPPNVANEGKRVAIVTSELAADVLTAMKQHLLEGATTPLIDCRLAGDYRGSVEKGLDGIVRPIDSSQRVIAGSVVYDILNGGA
jgi:hydrogenase maturation factor